MILLIFMLCALLTGNSLGQGSSDCSVEIHSDCPNNISECFSHQDCGTGEILKYGSGTCGICSRCVPISCFQVLNGKCEENEQCRPGLNCNAAKVCALDTTQCLHLELLGSTYRGTPECDRNGTYKAIQCKGDRAIGRCFCFSEQGDRIFGWDWWRNIDDMTCSCSRKRYEKEMNRELSTLHCTQNGNYEELQCEHDICWCADSKTGDLLEGTVAVPYSQWKLLPCYNAPQMGISYYRQCESAAIAQEKIKRKFEMHINETQPITIQKILCDYDGSYGNYARDGESIVCTWRDGTRIQSYAAETTDSTPMDCNCARDSKIFEQHRLTLQMACGGNGNYKQLQIINQDAFCIDRDGFAVSDLLPTTPAPNCDAYLYYRYQALGQQTPAISGKSEKPEELSKPEESGEQEGSAESEGSEGQEDQTYRENQEDEPKESEKLA